jgi:hypothetical protein
MYRKKEWRNIKGICKNSVTPLKTTYEFMGIEGEDVKAKDKRNIQQIAKI